MKIVVAAALAVLAAAPALAQTAPQAVTDAVTQAVRETATQAASEQVDKALGTTKAKDAKAAPGRTKEHEANYGKSIDHRMDDEFKGRGKKKNK